ncbi:conserved hypothetical protein [Sphingomonas aurantiaca]|jgi:hypothetical protein|uniref:Uncharacterized protein n=1 Tax=Sphingomonas aurantiaca TaxID=185949 RepID=A0A5E8AHU5_9SPHN|nr:MULTISPECIES: hypothetical protein [Sphingomonas]MBB3589547.1 hypothetical protein [Sphingomonas sp. BK481]VVT30609.1 conserved hypothetical protein [Sphingomonas aurantiaca]
MSDDNDPEFYINREKQERKLADTSTDRAVAAIHRELADRYAEKVAETHKGNGGAPLAR